MAYGAKEAHFCKCVLVKAAPTYPSALVLKGIVTAEQEVQTPQRLATVLMRNGKVKMRVKKMEGIRELPERTSSKLQTLQSRQLRHQSLEMQTWTS